MASLKNTTSVFLLALACFAFLPKVQAGLIGSPPPDGCYPNFTTAEGCNALQSLTTGEANTGVGWRSLFTNTTGNFNTGVGAAALVFNNGDSNTAVGAAALLVNGPGHDNTAVGVSSLLSNFSGAANTAVGSEALLFNDQTGHGVASGNTAVGQRALFNNIDASANTAVGSTALANNDSTGNGLALNNTAVGDGALFNNTDGLSNTAVGSQALAANTTGANNTAVGVGALANSTGHDNTALGLAAGDGVFSANNVICIGVSGESVTGTTWIGGIFATTTVSGTTLPVIVSDGGQLGTAASARRFKKEIKPMDQASESILALKPVTFHYKSDKSNTAQFGLVAEDVAQVNPDLVVRDKNGEIYSVRYDQVNAMLLNEFLKEHKKVEEQQATISELRSTVSQQQKDFQATATRQQKQIEALSVGLRKVSAQLELSKAAPQTVNNP